MNEEEYFEQLCSNSVDGTLTDSEKQKLEEHLAECPSCAALKEDLEQLNKDGTLPLLAAWLGASNPIELLASLGNQEGAAK